MAVRFRFGIPIFPIGGTCMHAACRNQEQFCGKNLDVYGDHAVTCNTGPYIFARHLRVNSCIAQAGRDAGYAALFEQVVPELAVKKRRQDNSVSLEDAFIDVELFAHPCSPNRLLDATVRHSAAEIIVKKAARCAGAAAAAGVSCKGKRYPAVTGKKVIPRALETWGFIDGTFDAVLDDLAVLAAQRQRDRGVAPTRWKRRWMTGLSIGLAMDIGSALLAAMPVQCRPCGPRPLVAA